MKRFFLSTLLIFCALLAFGQSKQDATTVKFMGVPVDGTEEQMIRQLKKKGFEYNAQQEKLSGEFNGYQVDILIHTTKKKVDRILVVYPLTNAEIVSTMYDNLVDQFEKNEKYYPVHLEDAVEYIPETEDIAYEMAYNKKTYRMLYLQMYDWDTLNKETMNSIHAIAAKLLADDGCSQDDIMKMSNKEMAGYLVKAYSIWLGNNNYVWFKINEDNGLYQIVIYYDNLKNQAHGEDL